jgi:NodT family efflux transporter outer membrane factor (OMF) lipoprotein
MKHLQNSALCKRLCAIAASAAALLLTACTLPQQPSAPIAPVAAQWQAPLPHQGNTRTLQQWWQAQADPSLLRLQDAAQSTSPNLSLALAAIAQARASSASARATLLPQVGAAVSLSRGESQPDMGVTSTAAASLQASWEIDLVGANQLVNDGAQAQLQSSQAQWHDARVALAAEVAHAYYGARACQPLADNARAIYQSYEETARLSGQLLAAGMAPAASLALARSAAADAHSRWFEQSAQCDLGIKALVALSALPEAQVRGLIRAPGAAQDAPGLALASLPAQTIAQRPDVFAAEREVFTAAALVAGAQAQRWPRLTINGSIGPAQFGIAGVEKSLTSWSLGPVSLVVPVFDAGQRQSNIEASQLNFESKVAMYQARVRSAVREVEEALVQLQLNTDRSEQAQRSYRYALQVHAAVLARQRQGMATGLELQEAGRSLLAADAQRIGLQWEGRRAWVRLYRAAGGGWDSASAGVGPASVLQPSPGDTNQ